MKLKCPKCGSTNVGRKSDTCICNKCGEEWQLSVNEIECLLKEDKKLSGLERRQLQTMLGQINDTGKQTGRGIYCSPEEKKQAVVMAAEKAQKEEQARANYQMWKERGDCTNCGGSPSKNLLLFVTVAAKNGK